MRFAVAYPKGGVSKTTVAVHLARHLSQFNRTLLIDGDPQETAAVWAAWRKQLHPDLGGPETVRLIGNDIMDKGMPLHRQFTHTVIDAGGRDGAGLRNTLLMAERLIIPIGNSSLDAVVLEDFLGVIEDARVHNPRLKFLVLLSRIDSRVPVDAMKKYVWGLGAGTFVQTIGERRIYPKAMGEGLTADEYKPSNGAALHELKYFYREVMTW